MTYEGVEAGLRPTKPVCSERLLSTYCVQGPVAAAKSNRKKPNEGGAYGRQWIAQIRVWR